MQASLEKSYLPDDRSLVNLSGKYTEWHTAFLSEANRGATAVAIPTHLPPSAWFNNAQCLLQNTWRRLRKWLFRNRQHSAFAFIAVGTNAQRRYLLQWNAAWQVFNLIGGKLDDNKGDAGSLSRALQRELEEEMGLINAEDFEVGQCLKVVKMRQFSLRERKPKHYRFSIFDVRLFPKFASSINQPNYAARWLSTCYENVFVSAEEIANLTTKDGRAISRTTRQILQALGEISNTKQ
jgi:8-oxo-dGTP pyrophosphatase MutT (NUDIX family)